MLGQTETVTEPRAGTALDLEANPEAAGLMPPTTTRPKPISRRSLAHALAGSDPTKAAEIAAQPEPLTPESLGTLLQGLTGGGATGGGAPSLAPSGGPSALAPSPSLTFVPNVSINKDGTLSVSLQGQRTNFQLSTVTRADPSGRAVIYDRIFDPTTATIVSEIAKGFAPPPAEMQKLAQAASAMGLMPGTPAHDFVVSRLALISQLPAEAQGEAIAQLEQWASTQGRQSQAPTVSGAIQAGEARRAERIATETRIKEREQRFKIGRNLVTTLGDLREWIEEQKRQA